jgi:predicted ATPase
VLWLLGYPDQALRTIDGALALARELRHPQSLIFALHATCCVREYRREAEAVHEAAQALVELSGEYGFAYWRIYGDVLVNWALAQHEETSDRIARVRDDIAGILAMGTRIAVPWLLSMQADLHIKAGQTRAGLTVVAQALDLIESTGEREFEAEFHRLEGVLRLTQDVPDTVRAEGG